MLAEPNQFQTTVRTVEEWIQDNLVSPAGQLIRDTPIGDEVDDLQRLYGRGGLCLGIEWAFRGLVECEYAPWPPESTTDGLTADLCIRRARCSLEFVGMCFIDFGGEKFPLRVELELSDTFRSVSRFTAYIGNVDPRTGAPPRLGPEAMILRDRDESGRYTDTCLLLTRRPVAIEWTLAVAATPERIASLS